MVNKRTKIAVCILGIIAACSCRVLAPKREYKYARTPFTLNGQVTKLDTSVFYYRTRIGYIVDKGEDTIISVLKFYSDGRFQLGGYRAIPSSIQDIAPFSKSNTHFYKIENEVLKLEVWRDPMAGFGYWEGKIYNDSIVFFKVDNLKEYQVFLKKK
jgi:hypothetical protein